MRILPSYSSSGSCLFGAEFLLNYYLRGISLDNNYPLLFYYFINYLIMKKNLQSIILLYFIYVNTCLAQSAKHYYLDVSYFNKLEYASLQKATFERTDYYYKLSKNQQIILRSYPTFKRLSELPEPRLEPTAVDAFLKDLKQNKQLDSTEVFVVEKSGDSYLIFAIKNWAIVYEDEQRISYQHPKLNFEYSKSKTSRHYPRCRI